MHELSITGYIVDMILEICKERGIESVKSVEVEIGVLTSYKPEPIVYYFNLLKENHPEIRDADIDVKEICAKIVCKKCGKTGEMWNITDRRCSFCGSTDVRIEGGNDVRIVALEI